MRNTHFGAFVGVFALTACLVLNVACWKSEEPEGEAIDRPSGSAIDLGRDDMAALPGAEVDTELLEQFPHYLRQESTESAAAIFAYYDDFFTGKGWAVAVSTDPIIQAEIHRYQLGDELAFVTIAELEGGRREVTLSRRQLRDDEREAAGL